jgi:hypothetical protein
VRKKLDIWPLLPIVIKQFNLGWQATPSVVNVAAALEHNDRVCAIDLWNVPSSQMGEILAAMQEPFPALTNLSLEAKDETVPVNSDLFLGGSTPRLQDLTLSYIQFPGLPKLLLSATHLTSLRLFNITYRGYVSPEAMVTCLFALTRLEIFIVEFAPRSYGVQERLRRPGPLATRTLLPALTWLQFKGVNQYIEDLVAWISAPLLHYFHITFYYQVMFDAPQLAQFISRTPKLQAHNEVQVIFYDLSVHVTIPRLHEREKGFTLEISCDMLNWQLPSMVQVCTSAFSQALSPSAEHLYLCIHYSYTHRVEDDRWLELLYPFTSVKNLYLSLEIVPHIAPAFQELVEQRVVEVLPALQSLFLEDLHLSGPDQEAIDKFVAARQLSGQPIAVSQWKDGRFEHSRDDGLSEPLEDDEMVVDDD